VGVPAPSLIWVHERLSGDMMTDGVPGLPGTVRGSRPPILSRMSSRERVAAGLLRELAASIRGFMGRGTPISHVQAAW
jgi:hypothetical protein